MVWLAETKGCGLEAPTLAELQQVDARIEAGALAVLTVESSVASRRSFGGTAPERVLEAVARGALPACLNKARILRRKGWSP